MKKKVVYSVFALCLLILSSCLGDPATSLTLANQAGVVSTQPLKVIYVKGGDVISSEEFQKANVDNGECVLVDYSIDMGLAPNTQDGVTYKPATIYENVLYEVPQWVMFNSLGDTVQPVKNELTLSQLQTRFAYIQGRLFLFPEIANHQTTQIDSFSLSYNPAQQIGEDKIYDLYLRSIKLFADTLKKQTLIIPCAFDIQKFINSAQAVEASGQQVVKVRLNYVSAFNKDTTKLMWKSIDNINIEKSAK